jgi:small subunit ribosomal protein S2
MKPYIFGERKNIYIIDLQKTLRYFRYTYNIVRDAAAEGKTILFVGTKKQASAAVKEYAESCGMPYVAHRWLGGMLTNYQTIKKSIRKLDIIEKMEEEGQLDLMTKKEQLMMSRKKEKLMNYLGGIREMKTAPDMVFVIDTVKERIAVNEANCLNIPVVAPIDTNCDPDVINFPIPGNDDAIRSIQLFCKEMAEAINEGKELAAQDGASEETKDDNANKEVKSADISEEEKTKLVEEAKAEDEATPEAPENADFKDDLKSLTGLGPAMEKKLIEYGITSLVQIANITDEDIAKVDEVLSIKSKIEDTWKKEAQTIVGGK